MRIVAISDTHSLHRQIQIPEGDVLVHAGDFTEAGTREEALDFALFFKELPHKHKIVIAGNHDFYFENHPTEAAELFNEFHYLLDQELVIDGVKFYGSPWQPRFQQWAFNLGRGEEIRAKWDLIPEDVDVLITHGAPLGIGDENFEGEEIGCEELRKAVARIHPPHHIFGHIHEGFGKRVIDGTAFYNVAICDYTYQATNSPTIIDL